MIQTPPPSTKVQTKKQEPELEPEKEKSHYGMSASSGPFQFRMCWGVKDRAGEWLAYCALKRDATEVFERDPFAFQLIEGCNPVACLDDTLVETFIVRKEKQDVPAPEGVPGA